MQLRGQTGRRRGAAWNERCGNHCGVSVKPQSNESYWACPKDLRVCVRAWCMGVHPLSLRRLCMQGELASAALVAAVANTVSDAPPSTSLCRTA